MFRAPACIDALECCLNSHVEYWVEDHYAYVTAKCTKIIGSGKTWEDACNDLLKKLGLRP